MSLGGISIEIFVLIKLFKCVASLIRIGYYGNKEIAMFLRMQLHSLSSIELAVATLFGKSPRNQTIQRDFRFFAFA